MQYNENENRSKVYPAGRHRSASFPLPPPPAHFLQPAPPLSGGSVLLAAPARCIVTRASHTEPDTGSPALSADTLWYKDAVFYELHVKAFQNSSQDGAGDFGG